MNALLDHAAMLKGAAAHLLRTAEAIRGVPSGKASLDADTHFIQLGVPGNVADQLLMEELVSPSMFEGKDDEDWEEGDEDWEE